MAGPLKGIRVVEMAHMISGPYAGMLLADLGADVTKVEVPGAGDSFRKWQASEGRLTSSFAAYNRGKLSVTINIKSATGAQLYKQLVSSADVVLENFRPGTLERYGLGYEDLQGGRPGLVYCSISGMGPSGPYRDRPAYDQMVQAMSGLWSQLTDMREPEPVGPAICDQLTGLYAVYGILGALVSRMVTGEGQNLSVSMLGSGIAFSAAPVAAFLMEGTVADKSSKSRLSQSYAFVASDGKPFGVHLSTPPKFWEAFARAAGCPELIDDDRFRTKSDRIANYEELRDRLQVKFSTEPRSVWLAKMADHDVPAGPLNDIEEALSDPQAMHLEMVRTFGLGARATQLVGFPVAYGKTESEAGLPPPLLGEHNSSVFTSLGYTQEQLSSFASDGII